MAALLVGTVVVLLGYASGIGVGPASAPASGAQPNAAAPAPSATASAPPTASSRPPINYIGVPEPGDAPAPGASQVADAPQPASSSSSAVVATPASTSTAVPESRPPSSPSVSCPADLVSSLLTALNLQSASSTGGLLDLGGLLNLLTGNLTEQLLPTLSPASLLDEVTALLADLTNLPGLTTTGISDSPALASACTTALARIVPISGAGQ